MKTEKIISKEMKEIINIETTITCDLCNNTITHVRQCNICKRDMCDNCTVRDDRNFTDYPTKYCKECWEIGKKYMAEMVSLQTACDIKIENLDVGWRNKARNTAIQKV